ncbi:cytochrome P450 [Labrys neptuniae]
MTFYPSTVTPPPAPLGTWRSLAAALKNPLEMWSADMFETDVSVMRWPGGRFITVTSPELARQVLLDDAESYVKSTLVNRILKPAMGEGLLTAEGEAWRAQRRAASPVFRHEKLVPLVPSMSKFVGQTAAALRALPDGSRVDVMQVMMATTLDIVVETLFGDPGPHYDRDRTIEDVDRYFRTHGVVGFSDYVGLPEWFPRLRHRGRGAIRRLRETARAFAESRATPVDGMDSLTSLIGRAVDPQTGKALRLEEVVDNVVTFVGAGHETTALAVTWALSILANLPQLQEQLHAEAEEICGKDPVTAEAIDRLDLHRRVIQETMRLYPPTPAVGRTAIRSTRLGDLTIGKGDHLTIAVYVLQRHAKHWHDPAGFDPIRFDEAEIRKRHRFAYMPFGGGARICIGMKLATMEATVLLATLMRELRFAPDPDHAIYPQMSITLRPRGGMPLFVRSA